MTKPREKTREELTAEIEDGKKKIRQFENREKVLRQKLSQEERRTRSHRLIVRGAGAGKANNPFGTKGALIHPCGRVRSAEGLSPHRELSPRSDMAALPQQGAAPLAPLTRLSLHTHKNSTPACASVLFLRVLLSYPGGDTHSHLPL